MDEHAVPRPTRMPRITIRRMMVVVAIVAVLLCVGIPIGDRLLWLYRAPLSLNLIGAGIAPDWKGLKTPARVNQPATVGCSYHAHIGSTIPSGLIYTVRARLSLVDTRGAVVASQERTHRLIAGGDWRAIQDELSYPVIVSQPGWYRVRCEMEATDLFGRKGVVAIHTGGLDVKADAPEPDPK